VKLKSILKTSVASAALLAVAVPVTSTSAVAGIKNGNDNALTVSGHINRSIVHIDDGTYEELNHVDGGTANSRMRFIVSGSLTDTMSIGGTYEMNMANSNDLANMSLSAGTNVSVDRETAGGDTAWGVRQANISFAHKGAGSLTIGQSTQPNNNGVSAWGGNNIGTGGLSHSGDTEFIDNTDTLNETGITAAGQFGMFDGGRQDGIKYSLPGGLPFSGNLMLEQGGNVNFGLNWAGELAGVGVKASGAMTMTSATSTTVESNQHVGVALSHSSGLGLTVRYGWEETKAAQGFDGNGRMFAVSYQTKNMTTLGSTHMRVMYGENEDMSQAGDEASRYGIHVVQKMPAGTSVHIGFEEAEYERLTNKNYDDVSSFIAGAMINF